MSMKKKGLSDTKGLFHFYLSAPCSGTWFITKGMHLGYNRKSVSVFSNDMPILLPTPQTPTETENVLISEDRL
jgi:hypothetical protein